MNPILVEEAQLTMERTDMWRKEECQASIVDKPRRSDHIVGCLAKCCTQIKIFAAVMCDVSRPKTREMMACSMEHVIEKVVHKQT